MNKLVIVFLSLISIQQSGATTSLPGVATAIAQYIFADHPRELGVNPLQIDACSSSPDGWWKQCCVEHDINYWIGGDQRDRLWADQRLYNCMTRAGGPASTYFNAVRVFGRQAWGIAWPKRRGYYARLSTNQCQTVDRALQRWTGTKFFEWATQNYFHSQRIQPQYASIRTTPACSRAR